MQHIRAMLFIVMLVDPVGNSNKCSTRRMHSNDLTFHRGLDELVT